MSKALQARLSKLEGAATKKEGTAVWWPDEARPADWDTAAIQICFPDAGCPVEEP